MNKPTPLEKARELLERAEDLFILYAKNHRDKENTFRTAGNHVEADASNDKAIRNETMAEEISDFFVELDD